jgi:hypothetical protein
MSRLRSIPAVALVGLLAAACVGAGASPGSSSSPAPSASPAIEYPTDPTAVILRMSTGGGFVAPGVLLTEVPEFSLYGDGTVVFRDPSRIYPAQSPADGVQRLLPFSTARLSTAAVQALLADAIGPGGLGAARDRYDPCCIADAPSTTFTIKTGGVDKQVTVGALGFEQPDPGPDAAARKAFQALAERLHQPDLGGAPATDYAPAAYRGILFDAIDVSPTARTIDWPWTDFGPSGFKPSADPSSMQTPIRTLTAADVAKLGLDGVAGGAQSILLKSDGRIYALSLRPLLPDETS